LGFIPDFSVSLQEESGCGHSGIEIGEQFRFYLAVTPTPQADATVFCSELGDHEMKKSLDTKLENFSPDAAKTRRQERSVPAD
jgi:hypothetical protein